MRRLVVLTLLAALAVPAVHASAALPQNDAGSGTDAPGVPVASFRAAPGVVHTGTIDGRAGGDNEDWYAFDATAGSPVEGRFASAIGCLYVHGPAGEELGATCWAGYVELARVRVVARTTGTHYVRFSYDQPVLHETVPQAYRFSFAVGGPAPATSPADVTDVLPASPRGVAPVAPATQDGEHVVVAVVDTGVNLYHDFFSAPALSDHPSTWLPGFPASATTVPLSLDDPSRPAAVAADAAAWNGLERSTYDPATDTYDTHLYTFPGTRVVGGVSFGEYAETTAPPVDPKPVYDDHGHGTHSAGLAAGANLASADGNVLVVAVEIGQGTFEDGIRWAARQPWIDAISVSLGGRANVPLTLSPAGERTGAEWATHEAHLADKPVFMASGNGVSGYAIAPDRCTTYTSDFTGPSWVTRVGAAKPQNGNPTWWHCVPVEATARTDVDSPSYDSLTAVSAASGTSASTPNVAGHFAHLLLAGRRGGSAATRTETLGHLLHAATPPPAAVGANSPSGSPLSIAEQGYGLVDQAALDAATARLLARTGPAPRPETEDWFARDRALRESLWGPGSATEGERPDFSDVPEVPEVAYPDWNQWQDDAGSGGDAPDTRSDEVRVVPGVRYDATSGGVVTEMQDWYAFDGAAGDVVTVNVAGADFCYDLVAPSGAVAATGCEQAYDGGTITATLGESGTWYLAARFETPQPYSFGLGVGGPAPVVFP